MHTSSIREEKRRFDWKDSSKSRMVSNSGKWLFPMKYLMKWVFLLYQLNDTLEHLELFRLILFKLHHSKNIFKISCNTEQSLILEIL